MSSTITDGQLAEQTRLTDDQLVFLLHPLIAEALENAVAPETMSLAASGDLIAIETAGRCLAVEEGRLIERLVVALARQSPDWRPLTGLKMPILPVAAELAKRNRLHEYSRLSVDPTGESRSAYHPDLVLVSSSRKSAIVVDVKRSLAGYGGSGSLAKLQKRMESAACILPELLWRDHQRTVIETVGIAIIDASRTSPDIDDGIWGLGRLDDLLDVSGSGAAAQSAIEAFREGIKVRWRIAVASGANDTPDVTATARRPAEREEPPRKRGRPRKDDTPRAVTVGLYRPAFKRLH